MSARNKYLEKLIKMTQASVPDDYSYRTLITLLFCRPFYSVIELDQNRIVDAQYFRKDYCDDNNDAPPFISVLEVLLALSRRVCEEMLGDRPEDSLFWTCIRNLGLIEYTDQNGVEVALIDGILERWLSRKFDQNGVGSPFPLKTNQVDQRKEELWNQMYAYFFLGDDPYWR